MAELKEIPRPYGLPLIGNVRNIDLEYPLGSLEALADKYGMTSWTSLAKR
jgi:cytochrome P450/NADPH-cytochrome P450 reductase